MATSKKSAAPKTTLAGIQAFPAKASPKAVAKFADRADAQAKPTRVKKAAAAKPPAVVAKAGKLLGADPKGVPGAKRTVSLAGTTRLSDVPEHEVYGVAALIEKLTEFPKGSLFTTQGPSAPFMNVYNMRGRLLARIKDGAKPTKKPAKVARADKL